MRLFGYSRPDRSVGIRNHLLIIPTVICANHVAVTISKHVNASTVIPHPYGCAQLGVDRDQTFRILTGFGTHPNVAASLVIGLGCEAISAHTLADEIAESGKPVEALIIQDAGGTLKAIARGVKLGEKMRRDIPRIRKKPLDLRKLVIGVECGGSDATSGIAANPSVGEVSDMLIERGGTVMLSETTELIGAEHLLAKRGSNATIAARIKEIVHRMEQRAIQMGADLRGANPSPGNIRGGITTIEEKSLGAICKAGSSPICGVIEYGEKPPSRGLHIMDTSGHDIESLTGRVAGGAHLIMFTTGIGTPTGSPIAPVVKVTGNPYTYRHMEDNIDIDVSAVIKGQETVQEAGQRVFQHVLKVIAGKRTKAEVLGHKEFAISRIGPTV